MSDPFSAAAFDPDEFDEGRSGEEILQLHSPPYSETGAWDADF